MKQIRTLLLMFVVLWATNMSYAQVLDEDFNATTIPSGWTQEQGPGTDDWTYETGGAGANGPGAAHSGAYNALFAGSLTNRTKLVSPVMDLTVGSGDYELKFWYALPNFLGSSGELRIYYKAANADAWQLTTPSTYTAAVEGWTEVTIDLPNESDQYSIAFEAEGGGQGVCLDDVTVSLIPPTPPTALNKSSSGSGFVNLAWTAPAGYTPASYTVYRNGTELATGLSATTYNDDTIDDDKIYSYYVTAYKVTEESAFSNVVYENIDGKITLPLYESFEILDPNYPCAPYAWTNICAGTDNSDEYWRQGKGGPSSLPPAAQDGEYNLVAKDISSSDYGYKTHLVTPTIDLTGVSKIKVTFYGYSHPNMAGSETSIWVKYNNDGGSTWTDIFDEKLNSQWNLYGNELILDATAYGFNNNYRLSFYSEPNGNSGLSTLIDNISIIAYYDVPENLAVTDESSGNVTLTWDNLPTETGYKIFRRDQSSPNTWTEITTVEANTTTYSDATVTDHTPYEYCISAVYGSNESPKTDLVVGVPASMSLPTLESFEYGGDRPVGWTNEYVWRTRDWRCQQGGGVYYDSPPTAYDGDYNIMFAKASDGASDKTKLVTPRFDLVSGGPWIAELTFQYAAFAGGTYVGKLNVYYKNSAGGSWVLLESYVNSTTGWEEKKIVLPQESLSTSYWLAFEGVVLKPNGVAIDYIKLVVSPPMTYESSTVTQRKTKVLDIDSDDNEMIAIKVTTEGGQTNPLYATQFNFDTNGDNGSNNPSTNITGAKLYYNPDGAVFNQSTATLFASKTGPNGTFNLTGTQELAFGDNYFFLCYDVPAYANLDEYLDAKCTQITIDGTGGGNKIPTEKNPTGSRQIKDLEIISIDGGNHDTGGYGPLTPSNSDDDYAKFSYLFTAEELANAGLPAGVEITQVQWNKSDEAQIASQGNAILDVYMKNTANTILETATDWTSGVINDAEQVIDNHIINKTFNLPNTAGWVGFDLGTTFTHDGNALEVSVDWNKSGVASPFSTSSLQWVCYTDKTDMILEQSAGTEPGTHTLDIFNYRPNIKIEYAKKPMQYVSSTTTQSIGVEVGTNQQVIGIQVEMLGEILPVNVTKFTLNAQNSDNIDDFENAKIFSTGSNPEFLTDTQFGTTYASPNTGSYEITGDIEMVTGINYFWLTYDIKPGATLGNFVDAECVSIVIDGNTETPNPTAPNGKTQIGVFQTIEMGPELVNHGDNEMWGPFYRITANSTTDLSRYSYVFTQTELEAQGMPDDVRIIDVQWNKGNAGQMQDGTAYFKIYANNSTKTTLSGNTKWSTDVIPGATQVVSKTFNSTYNLPAAIGWVNFPFTSEFVYTGEALEISTDWDASYPDVENVTTGDIEWMFSNSTVDNVTVGAKGTSNTFLDDLDYPNNNGKCRPDIKITYLALPMSHVESTCEQVNTFVGKNDTEQQIIRIAVTTQNSYNPISATEFALNVNGTSDAATDILNAKLFYTGTSDLFSNSSQFGSTEATPTGSFNMTGTQELEVGTNYFWLTYDIESGATEGNFVDAQCQTITISGTDYTPSVISPVGQAKIVNILEIGAGTDESTNFGPILWVNNNVSDYARWSYLFTQAEISMPDGAEITAVQWYKNNANNIDYSGNTYMDIYVRNSTQTDWADNRTWSSQVINGSTKVLDGTYNQTNNFPALAGWTTFEFDDNYIYNSNSSTEGIEIACDWDYTEIKGTNTPDDKIQWRYTSGFTNDMTIGWVGNGSVPTNLRTISFGGTVRPNIRLLYYTPQAKQYSSSAAFQNNTAPVAENDLDREILGVEVIVLGETGLDVDITEMVFNTAGTTNTSDLANAKLYYTASNNFFGKGEQIGTTVAEPSGAITFSFSAKSLGTGSHYFWLAYDIKSGATSGNIVDAKFTSIKANAADKTPTETDPTGSREVKTMVTIEFAAPSPGGSGKLSNYGPVYQKNDNTTDFSRFSYLFTEAELNDIGLPGGAKIARVEWKKFRDNVINTEGIGIFDIYIKNSNKTEHSAASWSSAISEATKVNTTYFDSDYNNFPSSDTWLEFELDNPVLFNDNALEIATNANFENMDINLLNSNHKFIYWYYGKYLASEGNLANAIGIKADSEIGTDNLSILKKNDDSQFYRPLIKITYIVPETAPTLIAATSATVDADFNITHGGNSTWRANVTKVMYGDNTLPSAAYDLTSGILTIKPSEAACLQVAGTQTVTVSATGYEATSCSQTIGHGVAAKVGITTQPLDPVSNGDLLSVQPVVEIQDQYDNTCTSESSTITATKSDAGDWTLGGTTGATAVTAGVLTYTNLIATANAGEITDAKIKFTASFGSNPFVISDEFAIPYQPPALTVASGVTVDADFNITYTDNSIWRSKITKVEWGGVELSISAWSVSAGILTIKPSNAECLQTPGTHDMVVFATGYDNTSCSQTIGHGAAAKIGINTQPVGPATNGGNLATQPIIEIQDQYNNTCTTDGSTTITAEKQDLEDWTLGGTTGATAVTAGLLTYSDLTATANSGKVTTARIKFTAIFGSNPLVVSNVFSISGPGLWQGGTSTDWAATTNWDDGTIPNVNVDVTIPTGCSNYPTIDETANCKNLLIEDGGSLTVTTSGDLNIDRYLTNGGGVSGSFTIDGGSCTINQDFNTEIGSTTNISGGTFEFKKWRCTDNDYAKGVINLSGGTINASENVMFATSDVTGSMTGSFVFNASKNFIINNNGWSTVSGGTINMLCSSINAYFKPSDENHSSVAYNLNINGDQTDDFILCMTDKSHGIDIKNNFTITSGEVILTKGSGDVNNFVVGNNVAIETNGTLNCDGNTDVNLNVGGNWTNNGTFTPASNTVIFNGTNQSILGTTSFFNLTKSVTSAATLTFEVSKTQTITGVLTLNGVANNLLSLQSSASGTQWSLNSPINPPISFVDVKDGNNLNGTNFELPTPPCVNSGNNTYWFVGGTSGLWTGTTDTDWATATNWDDGALVTAAVNVTIPTGLDNYPSVDEAAECKNLTVDNGGSIEVVSGGSLTVNGDLSVIGTLELKTPTNSGVAGSLITKGAVTVTGTMNVERFLSRIEWHFCGTPMEQNTANTIDDILSQAGGTNTNAFFYNEAVDIDPDPTSGDPANFDPTSWVSALPSTTQLIPQKGYMVYNNVYVTSIFTGTPNTGDKTINLSWNSNDANSNYYDGWNLVSNPYPSAIDWNNVRDAGLTNVNDAIYVWNGTQYGTYIAGAGLNGQTNEIPACQGFFVHTSGTTPSVSINNDDDRVHSSAIFLKDAVADLLRLEITVNDLSDETIIRFDQQATSDFDGSFDAYKLPSLSADVPNIYTQTETNNTPLSINTLSQITEGLIIPLVIKAPDGNITITASELTIDNNVDIYLEDLHLSEIVNLRTNPQYNFNYVGGSVSDRFVVHFNPITTEINNVSKNAVNIYSNEKDIYVNVISDELKNSKIEVYSILGQLLISEKVNNSGLHRINTNLLSGNYVVRFISNETTKSVNVFLK